MVHACSHPAAGVVAAITGFIRGEVGRMLAGGNRAVVAAYTAADNFSMIDSSYIPAAGAMTGAADGCRLNMSWVFARRRAAIMATDAGAGDI